MSPDNRVAFLVDGFNLYHSVEEASYHLGYKGSRTKWLNINAMCQSYLYTIRAATSPSDAAQLAEIYYFSAYATHMERAKPDSVARHKDFVKCLETTGVIAKTGRFKEKNSYCPSCKATTIKHEEKETDVAIAIKLLELLFLDHADTIVIVSGDTVAPPVRTAQLHFPQKHVLFAFPYRRMNNDLKTLAPKSFQINRNSYVSHQFPNAVIVGDGSTVTKPANW